MTSHIGLYIRSLLVSALITFLALWLPASASERPNLRATVTVDGELVTLGDLLDTAGDWSDVAVFRAPDPGTTGTVSAGRVIAAARQHGLDPADTDLRSVSVSRTSRTVSKKEVEALIAGRLEADGPTTNGATLEVRLSDLDRAKHVEATAIEPLELRRFDYDRATGRFVAILAIADSGTLASGFQVSGRAIEAVEIPVPARSISRGDTVGPADIAMQRMPRRELRAGVVHAKEEVVGRAARRGLRTGEPIRADSLMEPVLVSRNDSVTIVYRAGGLTLTARGRAIGSGARGDVVTVMNSQSNRTLEAEITRPGVVTVATSNGQSIADASW
jgi:flagellar basal body P-ring formation protein FlgA